MVRGGCRIASYWHFMDAICRFLFAADVLRNYATTVLIPIAITKRNIILAILVCAVLLV